MHRQAIRVRPGPGAEDIDSRAVTEPTRIRLAHVIDDDIRRLATGWRPFSLLIDDIEGEAA